MSCATKGSSAWPCMLTLVYISVFIAGVSGQATGIDWLNQPSSTRDSKCTSSDVESLDRLVFLNVIQSCTEDGYFSSACCQGMNSLFGPQGQLPYCLCNSEVSRRVFTTETGPEVEEGLQACGTPYIGSLSSSPLCQDDAELTLQEVANENSKWLDIELNYLRPDFPNRATSVLLPTGGGAETPLSGQQFLSSLRPQVLAQSDQQSPVNVGPYVKIRPFSQRYLALSTVVQQGSSSTTFNRLDTWRIPKAKHTSAESQYSSTVSGPAVTLYGSSMLSPFDIAGKYPRPGSVSILSGVWQDLTAIQSTFLV